MKVIFARTDDDALQLVSLCHPDEVALNLDFWREKYGSTAEFYALDCPDWELTDADMDDDGAAITRKATDLIIATLQRVSAGEYVAELEALVDTPAKTPQQGQKITAPPAEPDICPVRYVIWQPATNEFLAAPASPAPQHQTETISAAQPSWSPSPASAAAYEARAEAEAMAGSLVASYRYELAVCALHETASHYWKEMLREFFPLDSSPSLN